MFVLKCYILCLFAESVICPSFLISWTYIDAVRVNLTSLHTENKIAIQPLLLSILKVCLQDMLIHVVFLISSFGANIGLFFLFPAVGALCVLGRISFLQ